ncbi:hypothetical protein [Kutzneria sp. NPDC051319]|uniref:hypothetical protein n=1 Tax=Kutzneria sp. NPDC051319 TaxID=3155047 RepID=UPI003436E0D1
MLAEIDHREAGIAGEQEHLLEIGAVHCGHRLGRQSGAQSAENDHLESEVRPFGVAEAGLDDRIPRRDVSTFDHHDS